MTYNDIQVAEEDASASKDKYLRQHGWKSTCETPGSYWMWRRSFADVNARRLDEHRAFCERIKQERDHRPYPDEMLVDTDTAVRMTWAEIDPEARAIAEDTD